MEAVKQLTTSKRHPLARKRLIVIGTLSISLVVACIASLMIGQVSFSLDEIYNGIMSSENTLERRIVWDLRFPRILIGMIVGMCLAISGGILQGIMKNPLADPGIIGVT